MKTFFKLPAEDRQLAFQQVVGEMGLQAVSVEKEFWVCWTLRELFSMPGVREHLTFKGGTSLSKAWKFIELGARSDDWPHETKAIQPYVIEFFPGFDPDATVSVNVLAAERTFWEKACLLHEETFRPADKPRKHRMACHYYDLWCLLRAGVGQRAVADMALFRRVAEHREIFFRLGWVDYSTHRPGTFRLIPPEQHLGNWRDDYQEMLGPMFFGEVPTFEEILRAVGEFEQLFNRQPIPRPPASA